MSARYSGIFSRKNQCLGQKWREYTLANSENFVCMCFARGNASVCSKRMYFKNRIRISENNQTFQLQIDQIYAFLTFVNINIWASWIRRGLQETGRAARVRFSENITVRWQNMGRIDFTWSWNTPVRQIFCEKFEK